MSTTVIMLTLQIEGLLQAVVFYVQHVVVLTDTQNEAKFIWKGTLFVRLADTVAVK